MWLQNNKLFRTLFPVHAGEVNSQQENRLHKFNIDRKSNI